jgi:integrase
MPLSDLRIRQAKPSDKPQRLSDGGGLFVEIRPNGSKLWRYAFRLNGRPRLLALGSYPAVSLLEAREAMAAAKKLVKAGQDPVQARALDYAAAIVEGENSFELVAREWESKLRPGWSESRASQVARYLKTDLVPALGRRPIKQITSAEVLAVVRSIERRGPSAALSALNIASMVFSYAIVTLRADIDPTQPLRGAIKRPAIEHAAAHDRTAIRDLLGRVKAYTGSAVTRIAVELLLHTFVRTVELRNARWSEFDPQDAIWSIPPERMKKRRRHLVPITPRVAELLNELKAITGGGTYLFPNVRRPGAVMSKETINRALEYMGFPKGVISGHDFRATASTHLHEKGWSSEIVETQLAHAKKDRTAAAYNHAKYLPERRKMLEYWSGYLEQQREAAPEVQSKSRRKAPMPHVTPEPSPRGRSAKS